MTRFALASSVEEACPAPTIPEILADPSKMEGREDTVVFVVRSPYAEGQLENQEGQPIVVSATTEAEVLKDFNTRLGSLTGMFAGTDQHLSDRASDFRSELRYMGPGERRDASMAIARDWQEQLRTGPDELLVYIQANKSSALVFEGIEARLKELDPEAAQRLRPIPDWGVTRYLEQAKASGLTLVDDWAVTANGLRKTISTLRAHGLTNDNLRIHLLSASAQVLKDGIAGVEAKTHFTFPFSLDNPNSTFASIVGTHGKPMIGFTHPMQLLYGGVRHKLRASRVESDRPTDNESMPLLYSGFPVYDPVRLTRQGRVEYRLNPAERVILLEHCRRVETVVTLAERALYGNGPDLLRD